MISSETREDALHDPPNFRHGDAWRAKRYAPTLRAGAQLIPRQIYREIKRTALGDRSCAARARFLTLCGGCAAEMRVSNARYDPRRILFTVRARRHSFGDSPGRASRQIARRVRIRTLR